MRKYGRQYILFQTYIRPDQREWINTKAKSERIEIAPLVRHILDVYIGIYKSRNNKK